MVDLEIWLWSNFGMRFWSSGPKVDLEWCKLFSRSRSRGVSALSVGLLRFQAVWFPSGQGSVIQSCQFSETNFIRHFLSSAVQTCIYLKLKTHIKCHSKMWEKKCNFYHFKMNLLQKVVWAQFVGAAGWDIWIFGSFSFPLRTCQPHTQSLPQNIFGFFQKVWKVVKLKKALKRF